MDFLILVPGGVFFMKATISTAVGRHSKLLLSASEAKLALLPQCSGSQLAWVVSQGVKFAFHHSEKFLWVNKPKE